ncbi:hypothetical protein V8C35DRAFT_306564 [Trichoderma chlorosporum]
MPRSISSHSITPLFFFLCFFPLSFLFFLLTSFSQPPHKKKPRLGLERSRTRQGIGIHSLPASPLHQPLDYTLSPVHV